MATATSSKDLGECCRTCLNDASNTSKMYDIFVETSDSLSVAEILALCTLLKVDKEDSLPKMLCGSCYNCLTGFYQFWKQAQNIDKRLRVQTEDRENVLNDRGPKNIADRIKLESSQSLDYDILDDEKPISTKYILDDQKLLINKIDYSIIADEIPLNSIDFDILNGERAINNFNFELDNDGKVKELSIKQEFNNDSADDDNHNLDDFLDNEVPKQDLKCKTCHKKFKTLVRLEQHTEKHVSNKDIYTCKVCSKIYRRHFKYVKHLLTHGQEYAEELMTKDDSSDQKCRICGARFKSINSLAAHMKKHAKRGRVLACSICTKVFKKVSHLKRHELSHEVNKPFVCLLCPKRFNTESLLKEHANKHENVKPHICPMCGKAFSHHSTLSTHIKIHTREKLFLCPTCGKKFDSSTNLNQHIKRHMGLKNFACSLCPKKFISKGELKSHSVTHTGVRSWNCDTCGASFTKRCTLEQHILRHTGVKPHKCDNCPMKFVTKDHLKRHYRIHTGEKPYKCDMCERAFTQSNDLVKHKRSHLGDKLYKCGECIQSFRLKTELRHHVSEHFISLHLPPLTAKKLSNTTAGAIDGATREENTFKMVDIKVDRAE